MDASGVRAERNRADGVADSVRQTHDVRPIAGGHDDQELFAASIPEANRLAVLSGTEMPFGFAIRG